MSDIMKNESSLLAAIRSRRSIRHFKKEPVSDDLLDQILEAGLWAPSGKNNQPWKFAVIRDEMLKASLASLTHYSAIIHSAPVCIAIFLDHTLVYDRTKDVQAVGACIQNMLLSIHALGLGGVWLGEILKNKEKVRELLRAKKEWELMAVIALGHPSERRRERGERASLQEKVFMRN